MPYTWIEISESALKHNIKSVKTLLKPDTALIACVKGNAYGHGLAEVGSAIQEEADYLAVINLHEAHELRKANIHTPILVLGYITESEDEILWAIGERVEIVVNSLSHAERLSKIIGQSGTNELLKIHIKVDTGMARMGILPEHAVSYIEKITALAHLQVKGVMSHFADTVGHREYAQEQLDIFLDVKSQLAQKKVEPPLWHIAKTEAILDFPESRLSAVRLGIGLYGIWPDRRLIDRLNVSHPDFRLEPALSWKAKILQVKEFEAGQYVGYGCTYKTDRKTRVAVIPVGYYEGFDRGLSNKGVVLIRGERCPIIGRVCMNMSMADVTNLDKVFRDDEVVIVGKQDDEEISAFEVSQMLDTIAYEVVTRINPVIKRKMAE